MGGAIILKTLPGGRRQTSWDLVFQFICRSCSGLPYCISTGMRLVKAIPRDEYALLFLEQLSCYEFWKKVILRIRSSSQVFMPHTHNIPSLTQGMFEMQAVHFGSSEFEEPVIRVTESGEPPWCHTRLPIRPFSIYARTRLDSEYSAR